MTRRDPLDELAEQLFEAGRQEQPADAARERALRRGGSGVHSLAPDGADGAPPSRAAGRYLPGAAVAVALAAAALIGISTRFGTAHRELFAITPERAASEPLRIDATPAPSEPSRRAPSAAPAAPTRVDQPRASEPAASEPTLHAARARGAHAPPTLADEVAALDRARAALSAGDAARALALVDHYERVLRGTTLRAEAALLRIEALAASGRRTQAAALASRFVEQHAGSPLADRARVLAGQHGDAGVERAP